MSMRRGTTVVVEPMKSTQVAGGVKWSIRRNGAQVDTRNYKKDAVKRGASVARNNNGKLRVLNKDMSVSETRDYS